MIPTHDTSTPKAERLEYVEVERPRCPACRSPRLRAYRSSDGGDGSVLRHTACRECGRRFILVLS